MMKLLLLLLIGTYLSAGAIVGGNLKYSDVGTEININNTVGNFDFTNIAYSMQGGYEWNSFRLLGYAQYDSYNEDVVLVGEGDNMSYGLALEYKLNVKNNNNIIFGIKRGAGKKTMGKNGDAVGISKVNFIDTGIKVGYIYDLGKIELEASVEYIKRDFERVIYSTYDIQVTDDMLGLKLGANYKF